jgi:hypothetical protein
MVLIRIGGQAAMKKFVLGVRMKLQDNFLGVMIIFFVIILSAIEVQPKCIYSYLKLPLYFVVGRLRGSRTWSVPGQPLAARAVRTTILGGATFCG